MTALPFPLPLPLPRSLVARALLLCLADDDALPERRAQPIMPSMPLAADPDAADLLATRNGDPEAYRRLVLRHQPALAARLRRFTRSPADLEELVHASFVEAWLSLPSYSGRAPFEHWLNVIATRVGYAYWKRKARSPLPLGAAEEPMATTDSAAPANGHALHALLEQLPPRDRLVVTLLYLEERSVAHTAALTGWSQSMVKVQAFRARAKLKKLLTAAGYSLENPP